MVVNVVVVVVDFVAVVVNVVVDVVAPRNLSLKFGQNWVGNSWDIVDIEFAVITSS